MNTPLLIRGATIVNADRERAGDVLCVDGRIAAVGARAAEQAPAGAQVLDGTGRLLQRGQLVSGTNNIDITTAQKGLILLRVQSEMGASTWKLVKQ